MEAPTVLAPIYRSVRMWRVLLSELPTADRRRLRYAVAVMTISSFATAAIPVIVGTVVDAIYPNGQLADWTSAAGPLGVLIGTYCLVNVADVLRHQQIHTVTTNFEAHARSRISAHLLRWSIERFRESTDGAIYSRANRGVEGATRLIKLVSSELLPAVLVAMFAIVIAIARYGMLGLLMAAVIPSGFALVCWQISSQDGVRVLLKESKIRIDGWITSCLSMLKTIRTSGTERFFDARVNDEVEQLRKTELRHHIAMSWFDSGKAVNETFWLVATVLVAIAFDLSQTPGDMVGLIMLYLAVTKPLRELHRIIDESSESSLNAEDLVEDLRAPLDRAFSEGAECENVCETAAPAITFDDVEYGYPTETGGEKPVLRGLTFSIAQGERVGLVGNSGGGKSTVLDILERLNHDYRGSITVAGTDLTTMDRHALSRQLAYVGQKAALFPGTVRDNLIMGRAGITDEDLDEACRKANILSDIRALDGGYDSMIAQKGDNLSGGQQQRICIARALLKTPPIVLLDEPTSALDGPSQAIVQRAIDEISDVTMLVVAHRLNTLETMDRILVLHDGRVVQDGSYAELAESPGPFAAMLRNETWMGDRLQTPATSPADDKLPTAAVLGGAPPDRRQLGRRCGGARRYRVRAGLEAVLAVARFDVARWRR